MEYRTLLIAFAALAGVMVVIGVVCATTCPAGWKVWLFYRIACLHSFLFTRCTATNACTFPETGAAIIVANHSSPADPMLLWLGHFAQFKKPRLRVIGFMMAKEYYLLNGLLTWMCRALESIPVERAGQDMAPIREALRRLQDGHWLGLFPEGGINVEAPDDRLRPGNTGVAWLALKSRAPVIPVLIRNAPRSASLVRVFFKRTHTTLTYGPPVDLSQWQRSRPSHSDLIEVTDRIMQSIADLGALQITPTRR
jgi:1-acyl-sn-glycerol-3-phosphate acyltransferase